MTVGGEEEYVALMYPHHHILKGFGCDLKSPKLTSVYMYTYIGART